MKFKVYANIDNKGWQILKNEDNKKFFNIKQVREVILDLMYYELPTEVIVKYRQFDCDRLLCAFYNRSITKENALNKLDEYENELLKKYRKE